MDVYLGAASFVNTLKCLEKVFYFVSDSHILLCMPDIEPHSFFISTTKKVKHDCGYIQTTDAVLDEIFDTDDYKIIVETCKREYNSVTTDILHCSIVKKPAKRGKILTIIDKHKFNCRQSY